MRPEFIINDTALLKKLFITILATLTALTAWAQGGNIGDGGPDGDFKSLSERVLGLEKKNDSFNLFINYAASFQEDVPDWYSAFRARELRVETKGSFGEHLTYRLRHRLNKSNSPGSEETFSKATDIMQIGWKFNDKWAITGGKMCQMWGGFEFEENPMFIYRYSEFLEYADIFLAGAAVSYSPVPTQEFVINVTNSYSGKLADEYGSGARIASGQLLEGSSHPLCYIFNWNASYLEGIFRTRWAIGAYTQAKNAVTGKGDYYDKQIYLGQSINLPRFQIYFDYMGCRSGLDRLKLASSLLCKGGTYLTDVRYNALLAKARWQFADKFNLMGKVMYDTAGTLDLPRFRTSVGYIASLEYFPMKDQDLRFFTAFLGESLRYSSESRLQESDGFKGRIELGLMYRIKAY